MDICIRRTDRVKILLSFRNSEKEIMHKGLIFLILLILIAGCVQSQPVTSTTAPSQAPVTTAHPATSPPASVTTTAPTPVQTTATPALKPLPSPVALKGIGSDFAEFTTRAPGKVSVKWGYGDSYGGPVPFCKVEGFSGYLSGPSFESALFGTGTNRGKSGSMTFNLISPGTYKIKVTGCYGWEVTVNNA